MRVIKDVSILERAESTCKIARWKASLPCDCWAFNNLFFAVDQMNKFEQNYINDRKVGKSSEEIIKRLSEIERRLKKTTKPAPWVACNSGTKVFQPDLSVPGEPYYSYSEGECILDANREEILGCSEWMRVAWDDLDFMAHARSDIDFLVKELRRKV